MSPDQRLLVYASISPVAFVVNVGSSYDVVSHCKDPALPSFSGGCMQCSLLCFLGVALAVACNAHCCVFWGLLWLAI